jgi:hypothetical protein
LNAQQKAAEVVPDYPSPFVACVFAIAMVKMSRLLLPATAGSALHAEVAVEKDALLAVIVVLAGRKQDWVLLIK